MNLFMEFTREALAELECVTGDYEAKVPGTGVAIPPRSGTSVRRDLAIPVSLESTGGRLEAGQPARIPLLY
jgi:hypothetical protein